VNAFDQLTKLAKSRQYRETAQALGAVKQLSQYFKTFSSVERIAAVSRGVVEVQNVLKAQVMRDFEDARVDTSSTSLFFDKLELIRVCIVFAGSRMKARESP